MDDAQRNQVITLLQQNLRDHSDGKGRRRLQYMQLRGQLMADPILEPLLPDFVRDSRTLDQFRDTITKRATSYVRRRGLIDEAFSPILAKLKGHGAAAASHAVPAGVEKLSANASAPTRYSTDWRKVALDIRGWLEQEEKAGRRTWLHEQVVRHQLACALQGSYGQITLEHPIHEVLGPPQVTGEGRPRYDLHAERAGRELVLETKWISESSSTATRGWTNELQNDVYRLLLPQRRDVERILMIGGSARKLSRLAFYPTKGRGGGAGKPFKLPSFLPQPGNGPMNFVVDEREDRWREWRERWPKHVPAERRYKAECLFEPPIEGEEQYVTFWRIELI